MNTPAIPSHDIPPELKHALNERHFALVAQPIYPREGGVPAAHEMLIRLIDKRGSLVPAGKFIQAAAEKGAMPALDASTLQLLREKILPYLPPGTQSLFSLNVSAISLLNAPYLKTLFSETWTHLAQKIILEIPVQDFTKYPEIIPILKKLRQAGYRVAVDYFGSREMMKAAKKLQIDILKFDFCRDDILASEQKELTALITEANEEFMTIAARIENSAQHRMAKAAGFQYCQGNFYGEATWPCTHRKLEL